MKRIEPDHPKVPALRRFDARIDRLVARLGSRRPRRHVLVVFLLGRGDLILLSYLIERFNGMLRPGERLDLLVRRGYENVGFTLPGNQRIETVPIEAFLDRGPTRLFWSLRIARRRYRRVVMFDSNHAFMRDERLARLAGGEALDIAMLYPEHRAGETDVAEPPARFFVNDAHQHVLEHWAAFAAHLTGEPARPMVPRIDPDRLLPPARGARPHVLLHPFPGFASKFFRPEVYEPLVEALAETHDVLVSTGPRDLRIHKRMRALRRWRHVRFVKRPIDRMAALIRGADLVVTVDTGIAHLAIGCGAPTLVLHNTDDTGTYMPYPEYMTPPQVRFLEIPPDPAAPRRGWQPRRIWKAAPGTPERVREAGLDLLREAAGSGGLG